MVKTTLQSRSSALKRLEWLHVHANFDTAVGRTNGQWIYPLYVQNDKNLFCCGQAESSTNTCLSSTKGSTTPFSIEDGPVIFNRTSGSTSPNYTNIASITVTATAIVTATATTTTLSLYSKIPTSSSRREAGIGAGVGGLLGLALLVTFGLLWKQSKHKQSLRKDAQNWERKYSELMTYGAAGVGGLGYQPPHQRGGWHPDELDGRPHLPPQLEGWRPDEIDGRQVYEVATRTGAA
ncbi:hypothetical protein IMSHALPRED_003261 [Imshaugia aleurites]|uniref:Uncharacterized protein n=1 Tax=Imshaugia aleurites TaxID=172621 RepID=A0A8H3F324_9LECA|nr:hypothetical protein IMSHALPRED_003261 [Imshaugia aleurites]